MGQAHFEAALHALRRGDLPQPVQRGGLTFLDVLFLLFLGLKLADEITWSWWWVFSPVIAGGVAVVVKARRERRAS